MVRVARVPRVIPKMVAELRQLREVVLTRRHRVVAAGVAQQREVGREEDVVVVGAICSLCGNQPLSSDVPEFPPRRARSAPSWTRRMLSVPPRKRCGNGPDLPRIGAASKL